MEKPLVSIIIPVYNVQKYLRRCMDSVINQTYSNIEIIVINDGSTDNSLGILQEYMKKDKRVVVYNKENSGQAGARNFGLRKIRGKFLIMVDSDDYIDKRLIEKCLRVVDKTASDIVLFDFYVLYGKNKMKYYSRGLGTTLVDAGSTPWNKFYKSSLWEKCFFPEGFWYEDLGIIPVIVAKAEKIIHIKEALYYYEGRRSNSQSNEKDIKRFLDIKYMLDNVSYQINELGLKKKYNEQFKMLYVEHFINVALLTKSPTINDKRARSKLVDEIINCINSKVPDWRERILTKKGIVKRSIKEVIIYLYSKKLFFLGDCIWKYPKALMKYLA